MIIIINISNSGSISVTQPMSRALLKIWLIHDSTFFHVQEVWRKIWEARGFQK